MTLLKMKYIYAFDHIFVVVFKEHVRGKEYWHRSYNTTSEVQCGKL